MALLSVLVSSCKLLYHFQSSVRRMKDMVYLCFMRAANHLLPTIIVHQNVRVHYKCVLLYCVDLLYTRRNQDNIALY